MVCLIVLALLVIFVQALFARRLAARWRYNLWLLVLLRLLLPVTPAARFSVFNVARDLPQRLPDACVGIGGEGKH